MRSSMRGKVEHPPNKRLQPRSRAADPFVAKILRTGSSQVAPCMNAPPEVRAESDLDTGKSRMKGLFETPLSLPVAYLAEASMVAGSMSSITQ
jgi:hypothetical protein